MPKPIRAAVLERPGHPLRIMEIKSPGLQCGQVLVKIFYSGVCRSQLMEVRGARGPDPWLPHLLGHEGSGIVEAVGDGVTKVAPGDEVILGWLRGDGIDAPGACYRCGNQIINAGRVTTFSNYAVVAESRVTRKPPGLAPDLAVLFGCALPTGAGMVLNELRPRTDQSVVVLGLGGIGLSALTALRAIGVTQIIAADVADDKLEMARRLGANHILNAAQADFLSEVQRLTGSGADFCVESCGHAATIELGFALIRKGGGRLLFASHPPEGEQIRLTPHELISGKQIAGSWGGATQPDRDIPLLHQLVRDSGIPLDALLTKHYTLDQINEALDDLEAGKVFRPLIVMKHPDVATGHA